MLMITIQKPSTETDELEMPGEWPWQPGSENDAIFLSATGGCMVLRDEGLLG